jgi:hypothetical protein
LGDEEADAGGEVVSELRGGAQGELRREEIGEKDDDFEFAVRIRWGGVELIFVGNNAHELASTWKSKTEPIRKS